MNQKRALSIECQRGYRTYIAYCFSSELISLRFPLECKHAPPIVITQGAVRGGDPKRLR
jgi:hypothetical protein